MRSVPLVVASILVGLVTASSLAGAQAPKPRPQKRKPQAAAPAPVPTPAPPPLPAPEPPPSDVTLRTRSVVGVQVSENTTYTKGARQRVEFPGLVSITQCDLGRTVFLNDKARTYAVQAHVTPTTSAPAATAGDAAPASPTAVTRQGSVVYTTTITDTGERKPAFGREARHIRTMTVKDATAAICLKGAEQVDVDAWYIDLPEVTPCAAAPEPAPPAASQTCADRVERRIVGSAAFGVPTGNVTTTTVGEGDKRETISTTTEVTALEITRLAPALFDVPDGYTQVARLADLVPAGTLGDALLGTPANGTAGATPKRSGAIRVGVLEPENRTERGVLGPQARRDLVAGFRRSAIEAVPLGGDDADAVSALAKRLDCDYVLFSEITDVKTTHPGKVGGLMRRATGDTNAESQEVTIAWKLFPLGTPDTPRLTGTTKASSGGGFGVGSAIRLAAFAGSMYLNVTGMGAMAGMMGGSPMAALAGGGMGGFYDPRASALSSIAQSIAGSPGGGDAEKALRNALTKAFDGEVQELGQKLAKR